MNAITDRGYKYLACTADVQVSGVAGTLHTVTITTAASTAGVITLYDSLTEAGTVIAALRIGTTAEVQMPTTLIFDCAFATGLYVGYDGTIADAKITVTYI